MRRRETDCYVTRMRTPALDVNLGKHGDLVPSPFKPLEGEPEGLLDGPLSSNPLGNRALV